MIIIVRGNSFDFFVFLMGYSDMYHDRGGMITGEDRKIARGPEGRLDEFWNKPLSWIYILN